MGFEIPGAEAVYDYGLYLLNGILRKSQNQLMNGHQCLGSTTGNPGVLSRLPIPVPQEYPTHCQGCGFI